ncbi:MAG TPA: MJ0042-type zinc finger domain-containing protein [Vicinamibacterales bacterium]|nr:MJ0042-type zinc finger domain-containing protein [Vicinamibacterales bacterium]
MIQNLSRPHAAVALLDDEPDEFSPVTCPMCHTRASLTQSALDAGGTWRCGRCGQQWNAARLTTVAAYAAWVADRDGADRRSTERSREAAQYRDPPTERVDGTP